ncbi:MAG: acyl-CoA thioesterase [Anaerolineales bacterium]|jgi:acyl-CoA thioester hydrolase|nr:acyl-CoA thioesterase [Anaerolineales bacterium]
MGNYHFYHALEIRYADIDAQGHVNNAKYLTYMEQARMAYFLHLGMWDGASFMDIGTILAQTTVNYLAPIRLMQPVRAGVRVSRLGNKSLTMAYCLEDTQTGQTLATGESVIVAYDYRHHTSIPLPEAWRQAITTFETH